MAQANNKGGASALPATAAIGLDLFAAAWTERFVALGGSMTVNPDGTGNTWLPADAPRATTNNDLPAAVRDRRQAWEDGNFVGRTRELLDLLDLVPGGREAVKAHVRAFPTTCYANGTAVLA
jgi:hypothetical protein